MPQLAGRIIRASSYANRDDAKNEHLRAASAGSLPAKAEPFLDGRRAVDATHRTFASIDVPGGFVDAALPEGCAPFGIQALQVEGETRIVVTYAKQDLVANVVSLEPTGHITRRACMERRRLCQVCRAARLQNAHHCKRLSGSRLPR